MNDGFFGKVDKSIFGISALISILFVLWGALTPESAGKSFSAALAFFIDNFGWSYMLVVTIFLVFCLFVAFSKYGGIKLGKDDEKPEYSTWAWFAMLFSAGMGD